MKILLASPRGFCAGVDRAIEIVERALAAYGAPIYVRKEIVHNRYVVDGFRSRGVIFVDTLDEVPDGSVVVFSAHGIAPSVREEAKRRGLRAIDATCPLVTKVHLEVRRFASEGFDIILIGHEGHDEVTGTMGEAPDRILLVGSVEEAERVQPRSTERLVYLTQTTLSIDETREIVEVLRRRFPALQAPPKDDICYATQNRQDAVKELARQAQVVLVLGSANSSNSLRLCEVAERYGAKAYRIDSASELRAEWFGPEVHCVGVTAGASSPEILVHQTVERLRELGASAVEELRGREESIRFALPPELTMLPSR
ncbi:MAG: 4-hydroxy-3-methylbut-2-enyl diphosphate reductase [Armatimonadota bacterium]|nr:MAG: 4-hydroxy-3-methylbut-2-enyl diphosphate reductase [Armatimonadota bacterium]